VRRVHCGCYGDGKGLDVLEGWGGMSFRLGGVEGGGLSVAGLGDLKLCGGCGGSEKIRGCVGEECGY